MAEKKLFLPTGDLWTLWPVSDVTYTGLIHCHVITYLVAYYTCFSDCRRTFKNIRRRCQSVSKGICSKTIAVRLFNRSVNQPVKMVHNVLTLTQCHISGWLNMQDHEYARPTLVFKWDFRMLRFSEKIIHYVVLQSDICDLLLKILYISIFAVGLCYGAVVVKGN